MSDQYTTGKDGDAAGETLDWSHTLLTAPETRRLLARAQLRACDLRTRAEAQTAEALEAEALLVEHNARLVLRLAGKWTGNNVDLQDLIQAGMLGLLQAIRKFDLERTGPNGAPIQFSTYATWWVSQAIQRACMDTGQAIRLPVHLAEKRGRIARAVADLAIAYGREATIAEIAAATGYTRRAVEATITAPRVDRSLDQPTAMTAQSDRQVAIGETVAAPEAVEDLAIAAALREEVRALVEELPERERALISLRYGLDRDGEMRTLEEVGALMGVTRERIRQIEAKDILPKLRAAALARGLRAFIADGPAVIRLDHQTTAPAAGRVSA